MPDPSARDLLQGGVCYHTHFGWIRGAQNEPCRPILDARTAVRTAAEAGLSAIALRDLYNNSAGYAALLQDEFPTIEIVGGVFLNAEVGGINPIAVDTALSYGKGARFVCMATDSAAHGARMQGVSPRLIRAEPGRFITPFVGGKLKPEMYRVLELIAEADILLETGSLSPTEILLLLHEARQVGVGRLLVTHPSPAFIGMSIDDQQRAVQEYGALIEYTWIFYTHHLSYRARRYPSPGGKEIKAEQVGTAFDQITALGPDNCVLSTDFGQLDQPLPSEGLRQFMFCMLELGMPRPAITRMVTTNPRHLLGLAPLEPVVGARAD